MNKTNFTILLLGPTGTGKSTFVSAMSEINIYPYITKNAGVANTTKATVIYEFCENYDFITVTDCITSGDLVREEIITELNEYLKEDNGLEVLFGKINDSEFIKECASVTVKLPLKKDILPINNIYKSISVIDNRGFGDVELGEKVEFDINKLGVTSDVNTILFFSLLSQQQPAVFSRIINEVQRTNLKTPMFSLRRDPDLTINDQTFKENILENIKSCDLDLYHAVCKNDKSIYDYQLNEFVFNLPEVKEWKGALNTSKDKTDKEITLYLKAVSEIIQCSINMYITLFDLLCSKMNEQYKEDFTFKILNQLNSEKALKIVADICKYPSSKPSNRYFEYRDTEALRRPVKLYYMCDKPGIEPFKYEKNFRGNGSVDGVIPSYSYSCVNFREVFRKLSLVLSDYSKQSPLFNTFFDIMLSEFTTKTYTGYTFPDKRRDAFHFNFILKIREECTKVLAESNLVKSDGEWCWFSYTTNDIKYSNCEAVAVLVFLNLIRSLDLKKQFEEFRQTEVELEGLSYIQTNKSDEILKDLSRSK